MFNLVSWDVSISLIFNGLETLFTSDDDCFQSLFSAFWITSSAMVFHSLQAVHWPCHFEYFEALGKLARDQYPNTLLGHYYLARFYEETNEPKKAMKTYQSAYILDEIGGITKDLMLEKAASIKADFGY